MNQPKASPSSLERAATALAVAFLVFCATLFYVRNVPIGQPPDEWAHLSYIADVATSHRLMPSHTDSIILNSKRQNYLLHPPLYYSTLGLIGRTLSWDARANYQAYRLLSALMVAAGAFLWVLNALRLNFTLLQAVGLTVTTLAFPMFPYLAGSVNNDNLCYLGVALFFYGFLLLPINLRKASYLCASGVAIVCLTKATGALFLLAFIGSWALLDRKSSLALIKEKHFIYAAASAIAICGLYFIPTTIIYHTPFPAPGTIYQNHVPPRDPMSVPRYIAAFASIMSERLPVILTGKAFFPIDARDYPYFYLMLILPLAAWLANIPFASDRYRRSLASAFVIATAITILANVFVGLRGYRQTGLMAGIQPRYYAYCLPGIFVFLFADGMHLRRTRYALYSFIFISVFFVATIPPKAAASLLREPEAARLSRMNASHGSPIDSGSVVNAANTSNPRAGFVDRVIVGDKSVEVSGWAIDIPSKRPARTLWVSINNQLIGTTHPAAERKDVATAIGSSAAFAGFSITISGVPTGTTACDVVVRAEQDAGTLLTLEHPACRHPTRR